MYRRAKMSEQNQFPTFDHKLKALEIACNLIPPGNPPDDPEGFEKHMDDYFTCMKGVATLLLRTASWVDV
jgi:hypothetical protein